MDSIKEISLELIDDHPDNPRLFLRQDVIDGIAAQLQEKGFFDPAHALLVRSLNGRYQIIRGHQRKAAAVKAGLDVVPCWIRELPDDEAYLELGLSNAQGELKPIEIGIHALGLPTERGKPGGGLQAYADKMGKSKESISHNRNAAKVLRYLISCVVDHTTSIDTKRYLDKAEHLYHVSRTPQEIWPILSEWLFTLDGNENERSVSQAENLCSGLCKFKIPLRWQNKFLSLIDVAQSYIDNENPRPKTVRDLVNLADVIRKDIITNQRKFGKRFPYTIKGFYDWLSAGRGSYSWEPEKLREYYSEMKAAIPSEEIEEKCGPYSLNTVLVREIVSLKDIPDESIDLIFTDPPYFEDDLSCYRKLAELAARVLKPGAYCMVYAGKMFLPEILKLLCKPETLSFIWEFCVFHPYSQSKITKHQIFENWRPILLLKKEGVGKRDSGPDRWVQDVVRGVRDKSQHDWQQDLEAPLQYIKDYTDINDIVLDPFVGGGTTPIACQELSRHFLAFDKDPNAVQTTQERLAKHKGK